MLPPVESRVTAYRSEQLSLHNNEAPISGETDAPPKHDATPLFEGAKPTGLNSFGSGWERQLPPSRCDSFSSRRAAPLPSEVKPGQAAELGPRGSAAMRGSKNTFDHPRLPQRD
jgi:hypothetical protein